MAEGCDCPTPAGADALRERAVERALRDLDGRGELSARERAVVETLAARLVARLLVFPEATCAVAHGSVSADG